MKAIFFVKPQNMWFVVSAALLEALEDSRLNFDQAIFYRRRKFMHLSLKRKGKNRRQIIIL